MRAVIACVVVLALAASVVNAAPRLLASRMTPAGESQLLPLPIGRDVVGVTSSSSHPKFQFECDGDFALVDLSRSSNTSMLFPSVAGDQADYVWSLTPAGAANIPLWISRQSLYWPANNRFVVSVMTQAEGDKPMPYTLFANCLGVRNVKDEQATQALASNALGSSDQNPPVITLSDGIAQGGAVPRGMYNYYSFPASALCNLTITLTSLSGDSDLYISQSCMYPSATCYDYVANSFGNDEIVIPDTSAVTFYIAVYGFLNSTYTVVASTQCPNNNNPVMLIEGIPQDGEVFMTGTPNYYVFYPNPIPAAFNITFVLTSRFGDPDIFISTVTSTPDPTNFQWAGRRWGSDQVVISSSDPHFCDSCAYYVAIAGFTNSAYTLTVTLSVGASVLPDGESLYGQASTDAPARFVFGAGNQVMQQETVTITVSAISGDPDLYVGVNSMPTTTNFTYRSLGFGSDAVTILFTDPNACNFDQCAYYILVNSYSPNSSFVITASTSSTSTLLNGVSQLATTTAGAIRYFSFEVLDSRRNITVNLSPLVGFSGLLVGLNFLPNTTNYTYRLMTWGRPALLQLDTTPCFDACVFYIGVRALTNSTYVIQASTAGSHVQLLDGVPEDDEIASGQWNYYTFQVDVAGTTVTFNVDDEEGDPDLYVNIPPNSNPFPNTTSYSNFSRGVGEDLLVFTNAPAGVYYIGVYAYPSGGSAAYTLTATVEAPNSTVVRTLYNGVPENNWVWGSGMNYYRFDIDNSSSVLEFNLLVISGSCSLVAGLNNLPTLQSHTWATNNFVTISPAAIGTYYVGISGTCNYQLTAATQRALISLYNGFVMQELLPQGYRYYAYNVYNVSTPVQFYVTAFAGSDPDLFVSTTNPRPSSGNFTWSSMSFTGESLLIPPSDPHFVSTGTYYVAVQAFRSNCSYSIVATSTSPILLIPGFNQFADVAPNTFRYFYVNGANALPNVKLTITANVASGDVVLYTGQNNTWPTTTKYDKMSKDPTPVITYQPAFEGYAYMFIGAYGFASQMSTFNIIVTLS